MSHLPTITVPPGTPVFLADGHSIDEDSVYASIQTRTGHSRTRRVWTVTERVVSVQWLLEPDQLAAVDDWYENTLEAGALKFSAQVANQGAGDILLWWEARWIAYEVELLHLGRGRVRGTLLLTGEGTAVPPETGALASEIRIPLVDVRSSISVPQQLLSEITIALLQPLQMASEITIALLNVYPPHVVDSGDLGRIWIRLADTPVPGNEIDRLDQELLQRAWVRW